MSVQAELHQAHMERQRRLGVAPPTGVVSVVGAAAINGPKEQQRLWLAEDRRRKRVAANLRRQEREQRRRSLLDKWLPEEHGDTRPTLRRLLWEVARKHMVSTNVIRGPVRMQSVVRARQEFFYRAVTETLNGYSGTGRWFGRDHTTVRHGALKHADRNGLPKPGEVWPTNSYDGQDDARRCYDLARKAQREREIRAGRIQPNPRKPIEQAWAESGPVRNSELETVK